MTAVTADAAHPIAGRAVAPAAGVVAGAVGTLFGTMASIPFAVYLDAAQLPSSSSAPPSRRWS